MENQQRINGEDDHIILSDQEMFVDGVRYRELKELDRVKIMVEGFIAEEIVLEILTHTRSIDEKYFKIKHIDSVNVRYEPLPHVHREHQDMVETIGTSILGEVRNV